MTSASFESLYLCHWDQLVRAMRRVSRHEQDAEDIASTAFRTAFERRETFRGDSSFYTWLHRIALNIAYDRKRKNVPLDAMRADDPELPREPDLLIQSMEHSECCLTVRRALRQLPAIYRRTLTQHFVRGLSFVEMAQREGVPPGTIGSRMFKAKRLLKKSWEWAHAPASFRYSQVGGPRG